jgi:beta-1,4-N-acetylglucosaminyltransferase
MKAADVIITHCGAGSILEVLHLRKKAIGVINTKLLDNHQVELADAMEEHKYMRIAREPWDLKRVLLQEDLDSLSVYPEPQPDLFLKELAALIRLD